MAFVPNTVFSETQFVPHPSLDHPAWSGQLDYTYGPLITPFAAIYLTYIWLEFP